MTVETLHNTTRTAAVPGPRSLLRVALRLDAVVSGANGAAYLLAAGPLEELLGLPAAALRGVGAFLLVYGACVWLTGTRREISRRAVLAIIATNALWALDSVVVGVAQIGSPTAVATVWILLQAGVVGGFAALQAVGLRRAQAAARA